MAMGRFKMEIWLWTVMVITYGYGGSFARVPGRTEIMEIQSLENADLGIRKSGVTSCP